ncbi:nuclear transport factor 2 family protein [Rapidithrix thailandica]|uniref:Nuclear transport factor 2 family protein n=1 Tax=Rapidithrix thailandica TaxID=413964 RepID=A0AAW9SBB0_9BACT
MKKRIVQSHPVHLLILLLGIAGFLQSCNTAPPDQKMEPMDNKAAIMEANKAFEEAVAQQDAAKVAELYTMDGQILPTGHDILSGHEAIQNFISTVMEEGNVRRVELETLEAEAIGETSFEVGRYSLFGENDEMVDQGKYIVIWKMEDGKWKLHRDIFNSNMAPEQGMDSEMMDESEEK